MQGLLIQKKENVFDCKKKIMIVRKVTKSIIFA
jgi:hypothetical protein